GKELELTIIDKKGNKVKVRVDDIKEAFGLAENEQIKFLTGLVSKLVTQLEETNGKLDTIQKQQNESEQMTNEKLDAIQKQQNEDRKDNRTFQKEIIVELKEVQVKQDKMEKDINNIVDKNDLKR
ncbi:MAG: hypothetical protein LBB39_01180, partial [Mycoplasmataceae bacterium]|nr:hypothetical protein [Mycoplasmataceae bacterium]